MKACIVTNTTKSVIDGDNLIVDSGKLYVYDGEKLMGMFALETIESAYLTRKGGNQ